MSWEWSEVEQGGGGSGPPIARGRSSPAHKRFIWCEDPTVRKDLVLNPVEPLTKKSEIYDSLELDLLDLIEIDEDDEDDEDDRVV
eukprot:scaffold80343_cov28-Attheya_sp.AAC.1